MRHYPLVVAEPTTQQYRGACSCGWQREQTNSQRENAIRAARRHCQEANTCA